MRNSIKHVLLAAYTNSVTWIRSPRVWFVLLIQCIMCYGGLYELGNSLHQFGWKITPVECFLFIASRQRLLTGTLFLVFISEIPPQCGFHHFQWIRTTRSCWVYGCALYCYLMVLVMLLSLTVVSCLSFAGHLQWSTQWSDSLRVAKGIPESMSIIPVVIRSRFSPVGAYFAFVLLTGSYWSVSYTHLDVYKRQVLAGADILLTKRQINVSYSPDHEQIVYDGMMTMPGILEMAGADIQGDAVQELTTKNWDEVVAFLGYVPGMPTWIPDGWVLDEYYCAIFKNFSIFDVTYSCQGFNEYLAYSIEHYYGSEPLHGTFEQDGIGYETFTATGQRLSLIHI